MKQLGSMMVGRRVGLGPRRRGMNSLEDSLEAPTIVLTLAAMERQMPYFRDGIRGAVMRHLDHLMWATES
jgi:hypothetical protein